MTARRDTLQNHADMWNHIGRSMGYRNLVRTSQVSKEARRGLTKHVRAHKIVKTAFRTGTDITVRPLVNALKSTQAQILLTTHARDVPNDLRDWTRTVTLGQYQVRVSAAPRGGKHMLVVSWKAPYTSPLYPNVVFYTPVTLATWDGERAEIYRFDQANSGQTRSMTTLGRLAKAAFRRAFMVPESQIIQW